MNTEDAVLITGGYGVVGQQLARAIRLRYRTLPLVLAGRNPDQATALINELGYASAYHLDISQPVSLHGMRLRAIIAASNDPQDHLLLAALRYAIPYVDITRWTERVRLGLALTEGKVIQSPVMFSSAWMAGVAAVICVHMARQLQKVDQVDISVLYSMKDKAGPNSIEYMDRLATPFSVRIGGKFRSVMPFTDPRRVEFPGGHCGNVYRLDTPDQLTLPETIGASTVAARIAFDSKLATASLVALVRSGVWRMLSGRRFDALRRGLLFNPGEGAPHEIVIEIRGEDSASQKRVLTARVADPLGQTHLTAIGALIQLERILGLDGSPATTGVQFPDTAPQTVAALAVLQQFGIDVSLDSE